MFAVVALFVFLAVIALVGWSVNRVLSIGTVRIEKFRSIAPGMTSVEIIKKVGRPHSVTTMDDKDLWVWIKRNTQLVVWMKDGVVVGVPRVPESF
jgi:hypothetical protein